MLDTGFEYLGASLIRPRCWTIFRRFCSYPLATAKSQAHLQPEETGRSPSGPSALGISDQMASVRKVCTLERLFLAQNASKIMSNIVDVLEKPFDQRADGL